MADNIENKQDLISLFGKYLQSQMVSCSLCVPFLYTDQERTFVIKNGQTSEIYNCNHEEADTRLILHALRENTDVVIVSQDTDVLVLMLHAYVVNNVSKSWYMQIEPTKFICIDKIVQHYGKDICFYMPYLHAMTGCDTTSAFFRAGKVKVFNKCLKNPNVLDLLKNLGDEDGITP